MANGKRITVEEQLDMWVAGKSVHNATRGECCPDFSCCNPKLKASKPERVKFRNATQSERETMLAGFLGAMIRSHGHKVLGA